MVEDSSGGGPASVCTIAVSERVPRLFLSSDSPTFNDSFNFIITQPSTTDTNHTPTNSIKNSAELTSIHSHVLTRIENLHNKMKPVVGVMQAWSCIVISVFAIIILSVIGSLFKSNNHALLGGKEDPEDGAAVAATVFSAVVVYAVFIIGCGFQAYLHFRDNRRGAISLS
ncbi:hypothetical protein EYC84_002510 [Monilinia fructicola]|uniref:Uncharacterized protein n=1 Tax=Monilinia fructicola TaxID=38448 RepID=A0A5M9JQT7_MONFR|nr:hypothetical protein EYC84_002510 [Monilinia fructicola]